MLNIIRACVDLLVLNTAGKKPPPKQYDVPFVDNRMLSFQRADAIQAKSPALGLLRCFKFNCFDKALEEVGDVFWKFTTKGQI